jgi:TetR/AcrR family fatty acid metabolism transcriptional regulator
LTDRSVAQDARRRQLLDAAVRVFAHKGYHTSRVGDITQEAGVAHGLLYHYFAGKEAVLDAVFRETWSEFLASVKAVEDSGESAPDQLRQVTAILLRSWKHNPDLVRVLVRDIARSPELHKRIDELGEALAGIERIIARGQADGSFRKDLDPRLASWIFYGAVEEILTGWVLGQLRDGDEGVAQAERTVLEVFAGGLAAEQVAAST